MRERPFEFRRRFQSSSPLALAFLTLIASGCATEEGDPPEEPRTEQAVAAPKSSSHLLVQVHLENGAFSVAQVTEVPEPLPRFRGTPPPGEWSCQALDGNLSLLHTCALPAPPAVRGEFEDPVTGKEERVFVTRNAPVDFVVRVPLETGKVDFFATPAPPRATGAALTAGSGAPVGSVTLPAR